MIFWLLIMTFDTNAIKVKTRGMAGVLFFYECRYKNHIIIHRCTQYLVLDLQYSDIATSNVSGGYDSDRQGIT